MSQKEKKTTTNQPKQPKGPPQIFFLQSQTKKQQHNKTWIETVYIL